MAKHPRADLSKIKTISIKDRESKVTRQDFAKPFAGAKEPFDAFLGSLPNILRAADFKNLVEAIARSRREGKSVILMMGAHVVKVGLSPVVIDLLKHGVITAVAMNSAAAIHDVETAMWGKTSEDVATNLLDGRFGMVRETGDFINETLHHAFHETDMGYGEALGKRLIDLHAENLDISLLAACYTLNVPVTIHAAIGTDIVHQQPTMDGAATGELTYRDFKTFCEVCKGLTGGGVVLNIGSAVIMPEVFLKALTVARNLGSPARGFTTAVFDMIHHYRPTMNVQSRPTQDGGEGMYFTGHHELMIPLLAAAIKTALSSLHE